jgi:hypothetical protein
MSRLLKRTGIRSTLCDALSTIGITTCSDLLTTSPLIIMTCCDLSYAETIVIIHEISSRVVPLKYTTALTFQKKHQTNIATLIATFLLLSLLFIHCCSIFKSCRQYKGRECQYPFEYNGNLQNYCFQSFSTRSNYWIRNYQGKYQNYGSGLCSDDAKYTSSSVLSDRCYMHGTYQFYTPTGSY